MTPIVPMSLSGSPTISPPPVVPSVPYSASIPLLTQATDMTKLTDMTKVDSIMSGQSMTPQQQQSPQFRRLTAAAAAAAADRETTEQNNKVRAFKQRRKPISEARAAQTIRKFVQETKSYLNIVCPDSGKCIAFGSHIDELKRFFHGFVHFDYVMGTIHRIGVPSLNGFVSEIAYKRQGYKSYAILKSSGHPRADNLMYEYIVGRHFINHQVRLFPCFVETYGMYKYRNAGMHDMFKTSNHLHPNVLHFLEYKAKTTYEDACQHSVLYAILIQHVHQAKSMSEALHSLFFVQYELLLVCFILYHALAALSTTFTHYDLHLLNVLLYRLPDEECIQYEYHLPNQEIITFYLSCIPKIIDYGRSYFNRQGLDQGLDQGQQKQGPLDSMEVYQSVCETTACQPNCGIKYGFSWLKPPATPSGISSSRCNASYDLRLLVYLIESKRVAESASKSASESASESKAKQHLHQVLSRILNPGPAGKEYQRAYQDTLDDTHIYNVRDAFRFLKQAVESNAVQQENKQQFDNRQVIGKCIIIPGQPMRYERKR